MGREPFSGEQLTPPVRWWRRIRVLVLKYLDRLDTLLELKKVCRCVDVWMDGWVWTRPRFHVVWGFGSVGQFHDVQRAAHLILHLRLELIPVLLP